MEQFIFCSLLIFGAVMFIYWIVTSADKHAVSSPHYTPNVTYPTNTTTNTTITKKPKKSKAPVLLPGERAYPPSACLFGKDETGEFCSEGRPEPEFLTDPELSYWGNKNDLTADQCIDITTKRREREKITP